MVGGTVASQIIVAKTDRVAVVITRIVAYPAGFNLNLAVLASVGNRLPDFMPRAAGNAISLGANRSSRGPKQAGFLLGFRFSDGSSIATRKLGHPMAGAGTTDDLARMPHPPEPFVACTGGGGHDRRQDWTYWVAPLPPPGPLEVFVQWEAAQLPESTTQLDGASILSAANQATKIWDD